MENIIKIPAILNKYSSSGNRSIKVTFETQEGLTPEQISIITNNEGGYGHLLFIREDSIDNDVLEVINNLPKLHLDKNEKSPSEILKARMFVYFKEKIKDGQPFDLWYRNRLDEYGRLYLEKLT